MNAFFSSLATLAQEPRILAEALDKNRTLPIRLPDNYWRMELAIFAFFKQRKSQLPALLRNNFCPLFWFTNFLVLTSPLWFIVYTIIGCVIALLDVTLFPLLAMIAEGQQAQRQRKESTAAAELRQRIKNTVFDRQNVKYDRIREGHATIGFLPTRMLVADAITLEEWQAHSEDKLWMSNHPQVLEHANVSDAYFAVFCRTYGDQWQQVYDLIIVEAEAYDDAKERAFKELAAINEALAVEKRRKTARFIARCKTIGKVLFILVAIPVLVIVAMVVWWLAIKIYYGLGWCWWFLVLQNGTGTLITLGTVTLTLLAIVGIFRALKSEKVSSVVFTGASIVVWPIFKFGEAVVFGWNLLRMFYSENCPGIVFDDDDKDSGSA